MLKWMTAWAIGCAAALRLGAATPPVIISEFMAENNGYILDSFGIASDWLELQNTTGHPVSLANWSLTDSAKSPAKWIIPDVTLPPWGTLLIWASNADQRDPTKELHTNFALSKSGEYLGLYDTNRALVYAYAPTFPAQYENVAYGVAVQLVTNTVALVSNTSPVTAFCPSDGGLGTAWRQRGFDDSGWASGVLPAGYGTKNPAWLPEVNFSLQSLALGKPGVYLRSAFTLPDAGGVLSLSYAMTYDDGAAAFVNGTFACSSNTPAYSALTYASYSSSILGDPSTLAATDVTAVTNSLVDGTNVLAVHLLNCNASSSDLFLKPALTAVVKSLIATNAPTFLTRATPGTLNGDESTQRLPQTVAYSVAPGIFTAPFTLTLSGNLANQTIRYTTDGADPNPTNGTLYAGTLAVSNSVHMRARVFDALGRSGETATGQYTFCTNTAATLQFATSLPILVLRETDPLLNGIPVLESTNYTACTAHWIEPVGGSACLTSAPALTSRVGIHVRGSSSSGFAKKPYAVTFWGEDNGDKKVDLSGFPKASDFALVGCYFYDRTYMHDAFMFDLSRQLGRYAPRTRWVELFLIGSDSRELSSTNYAGLYVLEERVKAGDDRVPIDDIVSPADTTQPALSGSYLFKADRLDPDEYGWRTTRKYPSTSDRYMVMAYPKAADLQPEQRDYLVTYFNAFEDILFGSDPMNPQTGVSQYVDLPSWVDFHICKMFSMDVDMFTLSTWFHKDRSGKVMAGPVWDFDRSLGPYGYSETSFPNVRRWDAWTFSPEPFNRGDIWGKLHAQPAFRRLYWDRWAELRQGAFSETNLAATIARLKSQLPEAAATRDYTRWGQWPTNDAFGRTHSGEVAWMTWFVTNHAAWIDQNQAVKSLLLKPVALSLGSCVRPAGSWVRVALTAPEGDLIRYTLNGTDPALWNNSANPNANSCTSGTAIWLSSPTLLFARAYNSSDGRWGVATRAEYLIGGRRAEPGDVQLSEIHYHPAAAADTPLPEHIDRSYEFVEILNVAECPISLTGCRFPEGKPANALTLGPTLLKPGEHAVVARSQEAFFARYGTNVTPVACWTYGGLSDSGETVQLLAANGVTLERVDYDTKGDWPKSADGDGNSANRTAFGATADRRDWKGAPPTPGYGGYWEWLGLRGLTSTSADDDGDGVANLIEYYTGADPLDPTDGGRSDMQAFTLGEEGLSISYHQGLDRTDVSASLQVSEDLLDWADIDSSYLRVENAGDGYLWTLQLPPEEISAYRQRYFRLRVLSAPATNGGGTLPTALP